MKMEAGTLNSIVMEPRRLRCPGMYHHLPASHVPEQGIKGQTELGISSIVRRDFNVCPETQCLILFKCEPLAVCNSWVELT